MDVLEAEFVTTAMNVAQLPPPLYAEVAFAGRSNVGKSSLINSLAQRKKLARTSSTPGCTRGLNLFRLTLRGDVRMDFVDLPGYGFARVPLEVRAQWTRLVETYPGKRRSLAGIALLMDVRHPLQDQDRDPVGWAAPPRPAC